MSNFIIKFSLKPTLQLKICKILFFLVVLAVSKPLFSQQMGKSFVFIELLPTFVLQKNITKYIKKEG